MPSVWAIVMLGTPLRRIAQNPNCFSLVGRGMCQHSHVDYKNLSGLWDESTPKKLIEGPVRHTNEDGEQEPYTWESIPATTMTTRHAMIPSVH